MSRAMGTMSQDQLDQKSESVTIPRLLSGHEDWTVLTAAFTCLHTRISLKVWTGVRRTRDLLDLAWRARCDVPVV